MDARRWNKLAILAKLETVYGQSAAPAAANAILATNVTFTPIEALDVDFHEKIMDALEAKEPARAREAVVHDIREAARYMLAHAKFMAD